MEGPTVFRFSLLANGTLSFDDKTDTYIWYDGAYGDYAGYSPPPDPNVTNSIYPATETAVAPDNFIVRRHVYNNPDDPGRNGKIEELRLFKTGSANSSIALSYVSYGLHLFWSINSPYEERRYFVFGIPTAGADVPKSGSASYQGLAEGTFTDGVTPYRMSGTSTLSANFTTATVEAGLDLSATTVVLGANPFVNVHYSGTGLITDPGSSHFEGKLLSAANPSYGGAFLGDFYGPSAKEYGFTFSISQSGSNPGGGGTGVGVAVGK